MANYEQLKASIIAAIYNNGNQEITGEVLQSVLLSIVNIIGANATFAGIAETGTIPGNVDQNAFYIALSPGYYSGFGLTADKQGVNIFYNKSGSWEVANFTSFKTYPYSIATISTSSSSAQVQAAFTPVGFVNPTIPNLGDHIQIQNDDSNNGAMFYYVEHLGGVVLRLLFCPTPEYVYYMTVDTSAWTVDKVEKFQISKLDDLIEWVGTPQDERGADSIFGRIKALQDEQRAVYNANLITALNVGSSVEQALTVNGEYRLPISGDVLLSDTENGVFVSSNSFQTKVTFVYQIGTDIVTVVFNKQTNRVTSISTSSVGSPDDAADKDGSAFARIAQNAEDVKALQDEPSLHDLWLKAGATYQAETDTYTLNGLAGLTKDDMLTAWRETKDMILIGPQMWRFQAITCKTNFLAKGPNNNTGQADWISVEENNFTRCFYVTGNLEVLRVCGADSISSIYGKCIPKIANGMFYACSARNILGIIQMDKCTDVTDMFLNNTKIENIKLYKVKLSISFSQALNLSVEDDENSTLGFLVTHSVNSSPITITLHADAFARVPETLIQKAQAKQISIVSA